MNKNNRNILVTGGAGYIGSKISIDLLRKGYQVFVVDNLQTGFRFLLDKKVPITTEKDNIFWFTVERKIEAIFESLFIVLGIKSFYDLSSYISYEKDRVSDVRRHCANITLAKQLLKFKPSVDIKDGLKKTVEWYEKN
jgi:nucleoside-diphosphate-sugar epimerase